MWFVCSKTFATLVDSVLFFLSCSACPVLPFYFCCPALPACSACPVLYLPFWLPRSGCPAGCPTFVILFWLSCPSYHAVLFWPSCPGCPILAILYRQSCPGGPALTNCSVLLFCSACLIMPVLFGCHSDWHVQAVLNQLSLLVVVLRLSRLPSCFFLFWLSCLAWLVLAV
jgi:hypothetical protein